MFASKNGTSAYCLADYKDAKRGYTIPIVSAMWSVVEEWLAENNGEWAEMPDVWPPKTYAQELEEANAIKDTKEEELASKMSKVQMRNGPTEAPTIEAMRAAILTEIDSTYAVQKAALRAKYFGE